MSGSLGRPNFEILFFALLLEICTLQCICASPIDSVTSTESSKKICGYDGLYLNQTRKCYIEGTTGPCGELMEVKVADENLGIGKCECKSQCGERPNIFWPELNRCYFIFDQGHCPQGEWIVPQTKGVAKCENIPCPKEYNRQVKPVEPEVPGITNFTFLYHYVFPYKNNCYITDTKNEGGCPEGEKAFFESPKLPHVCLLDGPTCDGDYISGGDYGSCPSGSEPDMHGGCEPEALFD